MTQLGGPGGTAPSIDGWAHIYSGKVRDLYVPQDARLHGGEVVLVVASDRVSAFDHVLEPAIPDKGRILTALTLWWFEQLEGLVPNHVVSTDVPAQVAAHGHVEASTRWLPAMAHVDDTAAALVAACHRRPGLYHADSNEGWTFFDLASALAAHVGRGWTVRPADAFVYDQRLLDPRMRMPPLAARYPELAG